MRDLDPHQLAAVLLMQLAEQRFRLQRYRMGNEPRARLEPRRAIGVTAPLDGGWSTAPIPVRYTVR